MVAAYVLFIIHNYIWAYLLNKLLAVVKELCSILHITSCQRILQHTNIFQHSGFVCVKILN